MLSSMATEATKKKYDASCLPQAKLQSLGAACERLTEHFVIRINEDAGLQEKLRPQITATASDRHEWNTGSAKRLSYVQDLVEMAVLETMDRAIMYLVRRGFDRDEAKMRLLSGYCYIWKPLKMDLGDNALFESLVLPLTTLPTEHTGLVSVAYYTMINTIISLVESLQPWLAGATAERRREVLRDFDTFFYEEFLGYFRPKKRNDLGIWQTPQPVVDFITRSINELCKKHFGVETGDARLGFFDLATGTGGFLSSVVARALENGKLSKEWVQNNLSGCEFNRVTREAALRNVATAAAEALGEELCPEDINVACGNTLALDPQSIEEKELRFLDDDAPTPKVSTPPAAPKVTKVTKVTKAPKVTTSLWD